MRTPDLQPFSAQLPLNLRRISRSVSHSRSTGLTVLCVIPGLPSYTLQHWAVLQRGGLDSDRAVPGGAVECLPGYEGYHCPRDEGQALILSSNALLGGSECSPGKAWFAHDRNWERISSIETPTGSHVGQNGQETQDSRLWAR